MGDAGRVGTRSISQASRQLTKAAFVGTDPVHVKPLHDQVQGSLFAADSITGSNEVSSKTSWPLSISKASPLYLPFLP